ncbi:hypothetical protein UWK_02399 [Desulfocapsa sulfexigens DSM 10523]|uniref:Uncharacterized protein n=1 Tax=Desulfocapsa sulfexigens (strain DSM 10523 / SB164P1) TaxID=1167006 RepID=M1P658_DESSD|nr:hypothetical protein UWK_02399 [Desulfocapsa sulfexigens DSM 10523]
MNVLRVEEETPDRILLKIPLFASVVKFVEVVVLVNGQ